jgi:hypothetical protein
MHDFMDVVLLLASKIRGTNKHRSSTLLCSNSKVILLIVHTYNTEVLCTSGVHCHFKFSKVATTLVPAVLLIE